jgi:hypothetical protein
MDGVNLACGYWDVCIGAEDREEDRLTNKSAGGQYVC